MGLRDWGADRVWLGKGRAGYGEALGPGSNWVKSIGFGGALQRPFSMQSLAETVPLPSHLE